MHFNSEYDTNEKYKLKVFMAQYTSYFDQEQWKYKGFELLGAGNIKQIYYGK